MNMPGYNKDLPFLPPKVAELFRMITRAWKMLNFYETRHPKSEYALCELKNVSNKLFSNGEILACVFTRDEVIVNNISYNNTLESIFLLNKLRMRGIYSVTFMPPIPDQQMESFIKFLTRDPIDIKDDGGPYVCMRQLDITRIIIIETVYVQESDEDLLADSDDYMSIDNLDDAVDKVVGWLSGDERSQTTDISAIDLLKNPDSANSLMTEAVTRLHKSHHKYTEGQLINEILYDLKTLSFVSRDKWDDAISQIRKSISQLPLRIRPSISGFSEESTDSRNLTPAVDLNDIEGNLPALFKFYDDPDSPRYKLDMPGINQLFGVNVSGLLSDWQAELEPSYILKSFGNTYEILMRWSISSEEHRRIVNAVGILLNRAYEISDIGAAMYFIEILLLEAKRSDGHEWHRSNAKDILYQIDSSVLKSIVVTVLQDIDYHRREVAADLVEFMPGLAINMIDLLGAYRAEPFDKYLRSGITQMGDKVLLQLSAILKQGSVSAKESAIEVLINIGTPLALGEVAAAIEGEDEDLAFRALTKISGTINPRMILALKAALSHKSSSIRDAAVAVISQIRDESAIPFLLSLAGNTLARTDNADERIAAISALGEVGGKNELVALDKIAASIPRAGRRRYKEIRQSAEESMRKIRDRLPQDEIGIQGER